MAWRLVCVALLAFALTIPAVVAENQNDAGTGGDASNNLWSPTPVAPGSYSGSLDSASGDTSDFYSLTPTQDTVVHFLAAPSSHVGMATYVDKSYTGQYWHDQRFLIPAGHEFDAEFDDFWRGDQATYNFSLQEEPVADVAVSNLTVSDLGVYEPFVGELPVMHRAVSFDLADLGLGDANGTRVSIDAVGTATTRNIAQSTVDVVAGQTRHLVVDWDATGQFGNFTVRVTATHPFDVNPHNDVATTSSAVILGGTGVGLDPLNTQIRLPLPFVELDAGAIMNGHQFGAGVALYTSVVSPGAWFLYDEDTGQLILG